MIWGIQKNRVLDFLYMHVHCRQGKIMKEKLFTREGSKTDAINEFVNKIRQINNSPQVSEIPMTDPLKSDGTKEELVVVALPPGYCFLNDIWANTNSGQQARLEISQKEKYVVQIQRDIDHLAHDEKEKYLECLSKVAYHNIAIVQKRGMLQ